MSDSLAPELFRYGVGVGGAIIVAVVGTLFFEPPIRYLLYGIAVLDAVVTPYVIGKAMEQNDTATA
ncbi:hypothetical protein [Halorubellus litoreus]|uniref:Uncharacterized protein n=1 Tax=Halorubellus litoreus TaxID=755308 RepID=A0ABD5VKP0_9EURY